MNKRDHYGSEQNYPTLYLIAKLYIQSAKLLNKLLKNEDLDDDDTETLIYYTEKLLHRTKISPLYLKQVFEERQSAYNEPYPCSKALNSADFASFLVVKALRLKNYYKETYALEKDSLVDFVIYAVLFLRSLNIDSKKLLSL